MLGIPLQLRVRVAGRSSVRSVVLCMFLSMTPVLEARDGDRGGPDPAALAVVAAVNALAPADIPIDAAHVTASTLDRLPATLAELLPVVPAAHRQLLEECARDPVTVRHGVRDFDLRGMIDGEAGRSTDTESVDRFFVRRTVDVATGTGLSDGPYPISFDWALVLDPRSNTLFSFILNCRD